MKLFKKWKLWKKFFRPDYDEMPEETEYDEEDWKKIDFDKKELNIHDTWKLPRNWKDLILSTGKSLPI